MKKFDDLNELELVALATDEINHYIDVACAEAGVPLLPPRPPEAPELPEVPPHDATVYTLKWGYSSVAHFTDSAQANAALELFKGLTSICDLGYVSGPSYEKKIVNDSREFSISTESCYSGNLADRLALVLGEIKTAKDAHTKEKGAFDKAVIEREGIASEIRTRVREARDRENRRQRLRLEFDRYLVLADGSRDIAARFLAKAYPDAPELVPELLVDAAPTL